MRGLLTKAFLARFHISCTRLAIIAIFLSGLKGRAYRAVRSDVAALVPYGNLPAAGPHPDDTWHYNRVSRSPQKCRRSNSRQHDERRAASATTSAAAATAATTSRR